MSRELSKQRSSELRSETEPAWYTQAEKQQVQQLWLQGTSATLFAHAWLCPGAWARHDLLSRGSASLSKPAMVLLCLPLYCTHPSAAFDATKDATAHREAAWWLCSGTQLLLGPGHVLHSLVVLPVPTQGHRHLLSSPRTVPSLGWSVG